MVVVRLSPARGGSRRRAQVQGQARVQVVPVGKRIGVLGIDAGGTTGLAWWCGELKDGIRETLCDGVFGFEQVDCGGGTADGERLGAEAICRRWADLEADWTLENVSVQDRFVAVEDFRLYERVLKGSGSSQRVGLSSPRVAALVEGMLVRRVSGSNFARYSASQSKAFATSDRLKRWGLWAKGAPHSRDAAKQIALHVATLLDG